jgi:hypothetical protein
LYIHKKAPARFSNCLFLQQFPACNNASLVQI